MWAAALLAAIGAVGCRPPEGEGVEAKPDRAPAPAREERQFLTPVVAIAAVRGEVVATVPTTASVVPVRSRLLNTEEAGRLIFDRPWAEGDFVAAGTRVARLESDTLAADIDRAEADLNLQVSSLDINRKSMDSAVREYRTFQDLYSRGIAALKDLESNQLAMERAINSFRQGEINLAKSRRALQDLKDRLERLDIVAPFDGLLVARSTLDGSKPFTTTFGSETITDYEGRLVSASTPVCGLIDVSRVLLRADVTSRDIERIRPGQEARATIYAATDMEMEGSVAEIARAVSQDTRAFRVDVLVENPDRALKPGMFARLEIITERRRDTISLRKDYVVQRAERNLVYIATRDEETGLDLAREVEVQLGLEGRDHVEVTWGVQAGDLVIIRGFEVLQDKTPLTVLRADEPESVNPATLEPNMSDANAPTTPSAVGIANVEADPDTNTLRVLSLNLHTYQETDSLKKLEQVATGAHALNADILLLQEVGEHLTDAGRPNAGGVIRAHLERMTGQPWAHEWRNAHIGFDEYNEGLSILSRAPLTDAHEFELSGGGLRRNALTAITRIRGVALRICTVHTTWPDGGIDETRRLVEALAPGEDPALRATLIGGDFNATPEAPQIARLRDAGYIDAAHAAKAETPTIGNPPTRRIDYQFLKPHGQHPAPRIESIIPVFCGTEVAGTLLPWVSDHLGLMAVYHFTPPE